MTKITAASNVDAQWFNPTTAAYTTKGSFPNSGSRDFSTPSGWEDAVIFHNKVSPLRVSAVNLFLIVALSLWVMRTGLFARLASDAPARR